MKASCPEMLHILIWIYEVMLDYRPKSGMEALTCLVINDLCIGINEGK